ncbi:MAG TPA: hypothetical protein DIT65_04860 [Cryomorphaceae bacterium]|nr:hypothetical protein [Cryomorphaceae bacterium]
MAASVLAVGCAGEKAEEVTTGEAQQVIEVAEATLYAVTEGSAITWRGFKASGDEHIGTVSITEGSFAVDGQMLVGGRVIIDMNTITNNDIESEKGRSRLVGHLRSKEFFYVDSFPIALFEITSVEEVEGELTNSLVTGNLTLRGTTNSIQFPADINLTGDFVELKAPKFGIDRTKWGVMYDVKDDVSLTDALKEKLVDHTIELKFYIKANA